MPVEEYVTQMIAYKRTVTIKNPRELVLNDLPFRPGQRVEVVLLVEEVTPDDSASELRKLLKDTQSLPVALTITEDEIAAEIAAYRAGLRENSD